jgi:phage terminase small subunit
MPTPRKSTEVLEQSGAFKHDPQRRDARANEPKPVGELGTAPVYMTKEQKKLWKELANQVTPGWLTIAERWAVELAVTLMSKMRDGTIKTAEYTALASLMSKLGLTPSDRSRVSVPKTKDSAGEWAAFTPGSNPK